MNNELMGLSEILSPISTSEFLEKYWDKQPLLVKRSKPGYFKSVSGFREFESALAIAVANGKDVQIGKIYDGGKTVQRFLDNGEAVWPTAITAFKNGYTIALYTVEKKLSPMSPLFQNLERELGAVVSGIFFASLGAVGQAYSAHCDEDDNYALQLHGSKRWRVWKPEPNWLPGAKMFRMEEVESLGKPVLDVVVEDGDLLYVPRGWPHCVLTTHEPSLHLSLVPDACTWLDFLQEGIHQASLAQLLDSQFCKSLPLGFMRKDASELKEHFDSLLMKLMEKIDFETALDSQKKKLRRKMLVRGESHFLECINSQLTDAYSKFRVRPKLRDELQISLSGTSATLNFVGNELELPIQAAPALQFIVCESSFRALDLPLDAEIDVKVRLLQDLVDGGLLESSEEDNP
jgi:ribosomal protein L16 Arg81 hydroxylase